MRLQSQECTEKMLKLLQELNECRDNDTFNRLHAELQNLLRFEASWSGTNGNFLERYIGQEASLHVHYGVTFPSIKGDGWDLCALLESTDNGCGVKSSGRIEILTNSHTGQNRIEVSMFVDVRKLGDNCHDVMMPRPTMVRLQTLDECKSRFGDARKNRVETIIGGVLGRCNPQRKQSAPVPFGGQHDAAGIRFDEFESQVINGRPELINNFPRQNSNIERRFDQKINSFFSVRILDDFVRTCFGSDIDNDAIDFIQVLLCPDDFSYGGVESANHATDSSKFG